MSTKKINAKTTLTTNTSKAINKPSISVKTPRTVTNQMIAERAYQIYLSGRGGSEQDNWFQAERELKGQQ